MEEIELKIEDFKKDGIFAISLVDKPAIESDFIFLNSHEIELKVINEEKRLVVGLALIPEKRIFRVVNDKKFNIYFTKETIALASQMYMEQLNLNNVTIDHQSKVNGVSVVESWIVEDSKNDKSNIYNLNAVDGSWVIAMKVNNDEVWNDIKLGKYKGFSIEAMFSGMEEILNQQAQPTEEEIRKELIDFLNTIK